MAAERSDLNMAWRATRCASCCGLGFCAETMDRCGFCGGTGTGMAKEDGGVGEGRTQAERTPLAGTDAGPRRLERKRVVVMMRPICTRCRGRLYLEPAPMKDGAREVVCMMCGWRGYFGGRPGADDEEEEEGGRNQG